MVERIGLDPRINGGTLQKANAAPAGADFGAILRAKMESARPSEKTGLIMSAHASERLASRGIQLTESDMNRIASGVDMAASKGSREALVLLGDVGLIVNVPNRTVVTAMDSAGQDSRVFTNIDSTVVLSRGWAGPR
jgi:flagellar operon protein